jgi:dTDP-4-dehydrorhamnose 3,5-epimerase
MRVEWSTIAGVRLTSPSDFVDDRGSFKKLYDGGPDPAEHLTVNQVAITHNVRRGTIRGMHYQAPPYEELKALWCCTGEVWDVLVDVRSDQPTYGHWAAVLLSAGTAQLLTIPRGVAHGYQTLVDGSAITYLIEGTHIPHAARTLAWDDPVVGIDWPLPPSMISEGDRAGASWPAS